MAAGGTRENPDQFGSGGSTEGGDGRGAPSAPHVREGMSALGKYFRIEVPNFNNASGDAEKMTSYLHLGAVREPRQAGSATAPRASGEDLAGRVQSFIDDTRLRDGCPDFIPESERQAETAKLHVKGGWRDHSDGNRITTTRGDKVEVIKGNYKMVVLSRQEDEASWDVSGGHIAEGGITFAGSSSIEWTQNYDGTWKVTEETIKGDVRSTYQGDVFDAYYGNLKESITGSERPAEGRENPAITDRTWARIIESYTGSEALPIPLIHDETYAESITSKTTADSMSDETDVSGSIESSTSAGSMSSTTTAGAITDTTTAGIITSTTVGPSLSTIIGSETEIIVGNSGELNLGLQDSITLGAVLDLTVAFMLDVSIAGKLEVSIGRSYKFDAEANFDITPMKVKTAIMDVESGAQKSVIAGLIKLM